jgi:hypothetical protein
MIKRRIAILPSNRPEWQARRSVRLSLMHGTGLLLPGGVALIRALTAIKSLKGINKDQNHDIEIAMRANEARCARSPFLTVSRKRAERIRVCVLRQI